MRSAAFAGMALFGARVTMGLFFLYEAIGQIAKGWLGGDGLHNMLQSALDDNAIPAPYRRFLEDAVLPHTDLWTPLVIAGELAVGIALVLGLATRLTAISALIMNANFFVMNGAYTAGAIIDAVFVALEVALILWPHRQAFSVDAVLARRGLRSWWLSGNIAASPPTTLRRKVDPAR